MKAAFLAVSLLLAPQAFARPDVVNDPERRQDKYAHFGISATVTATFQTIVKGFHPAHRVSDENRAFTSTLAIAIGALKEYRDMARGSSLNESRHDMTADSLGVIMGNLIHWEF